MVSSLENSEIAAQFYVVPKVGQCNGTAQRCLSGSVSATQVTQSLAVSPLKVGLVGMV